MGRLDDLRIRQLDETLTRIHAAHGQPAPRDGWIKTIRTALGMSLRQLAERVGLSKTAVHSIESNEPAGTVQLDSLRSLAEGLDCDLVYALVPRGHGSLQDILDRQAERIAEGVVSRVSESMELEEQGVEAGERTRQVQELKAELLRDRGRTFWDV